MTQNEDDIWRANLDGIKNLIAAAKAHAPQVRFVMASTGLVNDADASHPGLEDDATNPKLAYPAGKTSPRRTSFATADSTGASFVSPLSMAMGTDIWRWYRRWSRVSSGTRRRTFSLVHQRDVARAVELALTGVMDGLIVNIVEDAPTTVYEIASLVSSPIEPSAEPLTGPWMGRMDGSRSRALGFQPTVPTVYQAMQQGIL